MTKSYEERMAEKYNFLKKDEDINKTQPTIKKNIDKYDADPKNKPKADIDTTSRIVPKDTPGSVLAMRGGDLPNPFYYQVGGPEEKVDEIVAISEGSEKANIAKVVELHKNWLETGAVPDGLSDDQIKRLAKMREKQLNIIDNLPDDYKLGYYRPDATTSHAITLDNFIQERKQNVTPEVKNVSEDSLLVPLDAWNTVLNQLGNLHEASQQMAEARERAAKAEAEAEFLREKLKNTRQQLEDNNKKKRFFFF